MTICAFGEKLLQEATGYAVGGTTAVANPEQTKLVTTSFKAMRPQKLSPM